MPHVGPVLSLLALLAVVPHSLHAGAPADQGKETKAKGKVAPALVDGELGKALDEAVLKVDVADGGFCGVVLVATQGKVVLEKGYGVADAAARSAMPPDALYDWASVSKQFTAAAVLKLIEASRMDDAALRKLGAKKLAEAMKDKKWKKLGLDDPLSRFFPEAPKDKAAVTLRQLLNHTSGIESGFKQEWKFDSTSRDSLVACILGLPMVSKPGATWEYSNSACSFVAALIEKVSGMTFEAFCDELLLEPAGMASATMIGAKGLDLTRVPKIARGAGFTDRPKEFAFAYGNQLSWGYRGCGGVVASTRDLFQWDRALRGGKLLSKESLEQLYTVGLQDYALGWKVKKFGGGVRVEHGGGVLGVATHYLRHLDKDYVVALACTYEPKTHPEEVADRLARIVERQQ
ncbi:MAG TPA: serine hydrolase domain-containing protein [Planctomycetota bacterium]|nr:serine hydrolase domain-containing protein [Planctomycetota bacterium]